MASQADGGPGSSWVLSHGLMLLVGMMVPSLWTGGTSEQVKSTQEPGLTSTTEMAWEIGDLPTQDEIHYASGKHLLVDLYNADEATLNDGEGLKASVTAIIADAGMHMLSISMHQFEPQGVSVVAAISESHLTIHTWPEDGTALIDLFTCGDSTDLMAILPSMVKKFGGELAHAKWAAIGRGDKSISDIHKSVLQRQHVEKTRLASVLSPHHKIEVWQLAGEEYAVDQMLKNRGATARQPRSNSTKLLFLDDGLETSTADEQVYNEALVHPGLVVLDRSPERVAILGGLAGGALREVLKYKTVQKAVLVGMDQKIVETCREHIPEMTNCSWESAIGNTEYTSCFDSPRAEIVHQDALAWLDAVVGGPGCENRDIPAEDRFDAIVLDLVDPEYIEGAEGLYSEDFFRKLTCALSPDGVLVTQFGEAPYAVDRHSLLAVKVEVIDRMAAQFYDGGTFVYNSYVPSFNAEWSFAVACRSQSCANRWFHSDASVNRALRQRLDPRYQAAQHGGDLLSYFDGSVMESLQQTPKGWENLFCTGASAGAECAWARSLGAPRAVPAESSASNVDNTASGAAAARPVVVTGGDGSNVEQEELEPGSTLRISRAAIERLDKIANETGSTEHRSMVQWILRHGHSCDRGGENVFVDLSRLMPTSADHLATSFGAGGSDVISTSWTPVAHRHLEDYCINSRATGPDSRMRRWNISMATLDE